MKTFRTIIASVAAVLCAASCDIFDSTIELDDLSFDIGNEIVWNSEYMAYTIRLSLLSGEDGDYYFNYSIDSDPLVKLKNSRNSEVESGEEVALEKKAPVIYILPTLSPSKSHTLEMEFVKGDVSRRYKVELPNTNQNEIGVRIDNSAGLDYTRVILTNLMGPSVTVYKVTFYLDGVILTDMKYMSNTFDGSMDIDFARSESYTFEMPYLVAGEHILKIEVRSSLGSETTSVSFTEPQRKKTSLNFSYNAYTGQLMLASDYNPMKTAFNITVDITVRGSISYRPKQFFGIADVETESFTVTEEAAAGSVTPDLVAVQIDGGALKKTMDKVFSNTRTDAANAIGNANARDLHTDITSVDLKFTIHSMGDLAGTTAVLISPSNGNLFPIPYTYTADTWCHVDGDVQRIYPTYTVNNQTPSSVKIL